MEKQSHRATWVMIGLGVILFVLFLVSFVLGRYDVSIIQVLRILLSNIFPQMEVTWTSQMYSAVVNIRLPRILLACLVGCCLSSAGAAYQGVFQNPMASPDVLGASSGASFGAALAILSGLVANGITISAFFWSILTVVIAYLVANRAPGNKVLSLVLAGMVISSLFSAGTSYIKLVADPTNQLPAITYWLMGSLNNTTMSEVIMILPPMLIGLVPLFLMRWRINLLTMGDEEAHTLGVNTTALRLGIVICATLVTASAISVSGTIGWVGLIIPHLCRQLVGNNYRVLMPASMLCGAAFLLAVDDVSRNLLATEIPIGILTAIIGAPVFLYLLLRRERADEC